MKIHKKVILLLLFVAHASFAQWVQISTIGNYELRSVKFFNEHTGIVAGEGGVWKTTNSGINWQETITGGNFYSLSFPNTQNGFVVGEGNIIHKTIDNGYSWSPQISGTTNALFSVSFFNVTTGQAVGQNGVIIRTTNGGSTWYTNNNQGSEDLNCVQMAINGQSAFAVGGISNELILSTGNGGTNWIYNLIIPNGSLQSISYLPNQNGNAVAVGNAGRIRRSTNNGGSWSIINTATTQRLNEVIFVDANTGFICGNAGIILKTTNSGINWDFQTTATSNNLMSISMLNSNTGWAIGSSGVVLRLGIPLNMQNQNETVLKEFKLYQNYPNPFNPSTKIKFEIPQNVETTRRVVSLRIFDILGREVRSLVNENLKHGIYEADFNAADLPSGVYFYKLNAGEFTETKKMILLK
ncbi:MAG: T9SS type A sorting domain-containing protein [Ignavibacteria bacterium]|nr:T9SS type A sorting domain-containing protein [Ignavibacteria bacterium]